MMCQVVVERKQRKKPLQFQTFVERGKSEDIINYTGLQILNHRVLSSVERMWHNFFSSDRHTSVSNCRSVSVAVVTVYIAAEYLLESLAKPFMLLWHGQEHLGWGKSIDVLPLQYSCSLSSNSLSFVLSYCLFSHSCVHSTCHLYFAGPSSDPHTVISYGLVMVPEQYQHNFIVFLNSTLHNCKYHNNLMKNSKSNMYVSSIDQCRLLSCKTVSIGTIIYCRHIPTLKNCYISCFSVPC